MGKTTLLRRIRFAIEDDSELSKRWFPLTFPEEQYNITRMSDFWANCLDAFSDMLDEAGREEEAEQIDEAVKNLPDENEEQRARIALETLTAWAEREGKGLLLLLDNVDVILERLSKDQWELREILSHNNKLIFIGASATPIPATYKHEEAFYDFFQIHELRGLNIEETEAVLLKLAELRHTLHVAEIVKNDPARIKALRVLTGGNTRILVVLYQVLAQEKDGSVISELEQVLDLHTPYYKSIFEALPAQLQQIVGAMCLHWDPITAAELAALPTVRMETNAVSAQLDRLTREGVVEKAPTPTGEKLFYQVSERFFNIWYLMRASRRLRRKLIWLVDFLKIFYAPADLHNRAHRFLQAEPLARRAEMAFAYAHAVDEPALRHALEYEGIRSILKEGRCHHKAMGSMLDFEADDSELKSHAERIAELHRIQERVLQAKINWENCTAKDFWLRLGGSWALSLEEKKKIADKLETLSEQDINEELTNAERKQKRLLDLLLPAQIQSLMEAIRSGDMADLTDIEGADAAAIRLSSPILKAIARLESARKKRSSIATNEIEELRQIITLNKDSAYPWYELGIHLSENADLRIKAETHYRKALEFFPNHPHLWYGLGDLLSEHLERYDEAEAAYRKVVDIDPNFTWAWSKLGTILSTQPQRYAEAETFYRKAIEIDPYTPFHWHVLGNLQHELKQYDKAEESLRKAIEINPNFVLSWYSLGELLSVHLNRYDEAEAAFRKVNEIEPSFSLAWFELGRLLQHNLKRYSEAESAYQEAKKLAPTFTLIWNSLGDLLNYNLARYDEAKAAYHKVIEIDPNNFRAWYNLGILLHYRLDRPVEAEAAYQKAIEIDPNSNEVRHQLGNLLEPLQQFDKVEIIYRKAIEVNPNEEWAYVHLSKLLSAHFKRYDEAEAILREAIELNSNSAQLWDDLGNLLQYHLKRYDEAEIAYRNAVEISPKTDTALNSLAWFLFNVKKNNDEAEENARQAVALASDDVSILHTLACILVRQDKWEEAAPIARRFIVEGEEDFHARTWPEIITFFKEAAKTSHAPDAVKLLDDIGYEDRWRPLREALHAIAEGNDGPLLRVAPEIRLPAEELVAQLLPEGKKLESAIKPPRGKKPVRRRSI